MGDQSIEGRVIREPATLVMIGTLICSIVKLSLQTGVDLWDPVRPSYLNKDMI